MPYNEDYLQYVLEQLASLRGAVSRRMFGGVGLYYEELFFGLIMRDTLYFRVDDANRPDYEALGMRRFQPYADKPHLSFNYFEVPAHVLEDADELIVWARRSLQAAQTAGATKGSKAKTKRRKAKRPTRRGINSRSS
jgi:DNA transformation protein